MTPSQFFPGGLTAEFGETFTRRYADADGVRLHYVTGGPVDGPLVVLLHDTDPKYPDGLYLGLQYHSARGRDWTLDLWFVDEPRYQPDLAHLRDLLPALTAERRATILAIKHARSSLPEHRAQTTSYSVYRAVLEDGVRTPEQFDQWLSHKADR